MPVFPNVKWLLRLIVAVTNARLRILSRFTCCGIYDGRNLPAFAREHGPVDVLLVAPSMADREGALIHPGIQILQTVLRDGDVTCEILNYNLPVAHPGEPFD